MLCQCCVPIADLRDAPHESARIAPRESQILYGETFSGETDSDGWIYGESKVDGYTGFVRAAHLAPCVREATHALTALASAFYPEPDFKSRPLQTLPFLARLRIDTRRHVDGFYRDENGGWIPAAHTTPLESFESESVDFVETALKFLGAPYRYGGRSPLGVDCSGLVQLSMLRMGLPCPRDSDMQGHKIGTPADLAMPRLRGDSVYFSGHVAIMLDTENALNATARTMSVRIDPLNDLIKHYGQPLSVRHILPPCVPRNGEDCDAL